jgi:hypothetical protein
MEEKQNYLLRDIDLTLWRKFKSKCAAEGISIKDKIFELIKNYLKEK